MPDRYALFDIPVPEGALRRSFLERIECERGRQ
jgi:hypothetical protein